MNGEFPYNEKTPEMDKLKRAAFEVLRDNDGCECQDWMDALIGEYGEIVVDAIGEDPYDVNSLLSDYWTAWTTRIQTQASASLIETGLNTSSTGSIEKSMTSWWR